MIIVYDDNIYVHLACYLIVDYISFIMLSSTFYAETINRDISGPSIADISADTRNQTVGTFVVLS